MKMGSDGSRQSVVPVTASSVTLITDKPRTLLKTKPIPAQKSSDGIFGHGSWLKAALLCGEADPKRLLIPEKFRRPDRSHDSGTHPLVGRLGAFQCDPVRLVGLLSEMPQAFPVIS